ncbi:class I SAM-dependent methyltransferase [Subtercola sp. YIM 133946]|uniref:class I SAM-dependent methyltransferase n=1 Tax=Subtercola sp. YIM 133946 TaxID=3118909 RepID=UPI002F94DD77
MASSVEAAYSDRAEEYIEKLGSTTAVHPSDLQLVTTWAEHIEGPVLDVGCGPGHLTAHLAERGVDARGIDQVAGFIEHARRAHPGVPFEVGDIDELPDAAQSLGGVLAWYSLIHREPATLGVALAEFARVLRPGGGLLVGFFVGPVLEPFDHAVTTAYRWPAEALAEELRGADFDVVETHTRTVSTPRPRPHGAIMARLAGVPSV